MPFAGVSQTVPAACYCAGLVRGPDLVLFSLRHFLATFTTGAGTGNHSRLSPRRFAGDYCWRYGVKRASTKTRVSQHGERRLPSTMAGKISTLASLAGSNKAPRTHADLSHSQHQMVACRRRHRRGVPIRGRDLSAKSFCRSAHGRLGIRTRLGLKPASYNLYQLSRAWCVIGQPRNEVGRDRVSVGD